ncbi:MAG: 5-formyltetrahydrofolate cyclo-ligase, partial [Prevotella sp.]|nr:5-formyltetrahydrofolate cyclo-ligase [Prevotella sp.]
MTKPLLRQQMREAKRQHQDQLAKMSTDICHRLLTSHLSSLTILCYWPLPDEVDIRPLIAELVAAGKHVVLPRVTGDDTMELCCYTSADDLREGAFHIQEPTGERFVDYDAIDIALIPGMAFDAAGHRLGRGRGYYDRFLAAHPLRHTIGVCFPFQRVPQVPSDA